MIKNDGNIDVFVFLNVLQRILLNDQSLFIVAL